MGFLQVCLAVSFVFVSGQALASWPPACGRGLSTLNETLPPLPQFKAGADPTKYNTEVKDYFDAYQSVLSVAELEVLLKSLQGSSEKELSYIVLIYLQNPIIYSRIELIEFMVLTQKLEREDQEYILPVFANFAAPRLSVADVINLVGMTKNPLVRHNALFYYIHQMEKSLRVTEIWALVQKFDSNFRRIPQRILERILSLRPDELSAQQKKVIEAELEKYRSGLEPRYRVPAD